MKALRKKQPTQENFLILNYTKVKNKAVNVEVTKKICTFAALKLLK